MRLSLKIAVLVGLCATLLVLFVSLRSLRRDVQIVEDDIARDAHRVATSIAVAAEGLQPGEIEALVKRVGAKTEGIEVRVAEANEWPVDVQLGEFQVAVVPVEGSTLAVEVTESLQPRQQLIEASVPSVISTTVLVMLLSLAVGLWAGRSLVGRPVDELVRKARRVARGEFDEPVEISSSDEFAILATELNQMAGQLKHAQERSAREAEARIDAEVRLRHADRLRTVGQLAAGMAHELGTPLNVIGGRASLLERSTDEGSPERLNATTIREQTERIAVIVRRLMDFSRRSPSRRLRLELGALASETVPLLSSTFAENQVQLKPVEIDQGCILGDVEQVRQVVTNLLMNGCQAAGPEGWVALSVLAHPDEVELRVDDSGPGVPEEQREHVFEPFFTTKDPGEGTGLGLAVVDGIVRDHEARIEVGDAPLGGARFSVFFPREVECDR